MTAPLFLVPAEVLAGDPVVVTGDEGRHAVDVRRLRVGERVSIGDGAGNVADGAVTAVDRGTLTVTVEHRRYEEPPQPRFVVAQALAKGGRDEAAVEAMTEVGVDEVIGWQASRSVARWTDRTSARWDATARAAAKQSRRAWIPAVSGPMSSAALAERLRAAASAVVLHAEGEEPLTSLQLPACGDVVLVVGPEGGVTADELALFTAAGARTCRLGSSVLRASTAGTAALSVLSAAERWR